MSADTRRISTGFVTLRFDWRSHSAGSAPPESSLASELADMNAAIAYLRQHARVDPARIYVAGKSLGSLVAHRAFVSDVRIRAAVLLTPIVRRRGDGERNYPRPTTQARPWLVVLGEADPLCPLPNLYDWLATSGATAPVAVFAGDHLLNVVPETAADPAPNQRNVQQAIAATVHWLRERERTARENGAIEPSGIRMSGGRGEEVRGDPAPPPSRSGEGSARISSRPPRAGRCSRRCPA